jgi:3-methyladenine DNA glycosylase AlkD
MNTNEARELGADIAACVRARETERAYELLAPVLARRTPFAKLDLIGEAVGREELQPVNAFLEHIGAQKTEGGWVVIAQALNKQLGRDPVGALERCRRYIAAADVWYGADILGERVPGPALVDSFTSALELLASWREDENVWVRRSVGAAVHYWAKRSRGAPELAPQAYALLKFLEPMFEEWEMPAVKGVGWGLKTLGRHYPDLVADWLAQEIIPRERQHRAVMLRKALTYLSDTQRARALGEIF